MWVRGLRRSDGDRQRDDSRNIRRRRCSRRLVDRLLTTEHANRIPSRAGQPRSRSFEEIWATQAREPRPSTAKRCSVAEEALIRKSIAGRSDHNDEVILDPNVVRCAKPLPRRFIATSVARGSACLYVPQCGILDHAKSERPDWPDRDAPHVVAPELATECQLAVVQFDRPDWLTQPLAPDGVLVHRQSIGVLQGLDEVVLTL